MRPVLLRSTTKRVGAGRWAKSIVLFHDGFALGANARRGPHRPHDPASRQRPPRRRRQRPRRGSGHGQAPRLLNTAADLQDSPGYLTAGAIRNILSGNRLRLLRETWKMRSRQNHTYQLNHPQLGPLRSPPRSPVFWPTVPLTKKAGVSHWP